ncbi:DNA gyrase subunit A family protein [Nonlabens ponticola]|uniref:Uncharacterized protein n=1 Tax=Nonlabens ponticola TaxID=2496866 RepID=A0A3S9MUT7_9FLAO|nr:hypothetical protein [Nonlabens ponticola]AZQ42937.1 hypothetical protein EJ995_01310 [Nonlabens ponticola]
MKKIFLSMLALSMAITACNDSKKKDNASNDTEYNEDATGDSTSEDMDTQEMSREDAERMSKDMRDNVEVDDEDNVTIKSFAEYGELQTQVRNLSTKPDLREDMVGMEAYNAFEKFVANMPAYLKTNAVMKEVQDTRVAMDRFKADLEDESVSKETMKRHLMKVETAVEDLNDEIASVRQGLDASDIDYTAYNDFATNVNYGDNGLIYITGFDAFNQAQRDYILMRDGDMDEKMKYETSLKKDFKALAQNIPSYLLVDDVEDEIEDVQEEIAYYEKYKNDKSVDAEQQLENLEEIEEAMYDLNRELVKARKKYVDNRKDAIEEFMEEFNDDDGRSMEARLKDATEEYNEEIED